MVSSHLVHWGLVWQEVASLPVEVSSSNCPHSHSWYVHHVLVPQRAAVERFIVVIIFYYVKLCWLTSFDFGFIVQATGGLSA
jgi:hypothetical protein